MIHIDNKHLQRFERLWTLIRACCIMENLSARERELYIKYRGTVWSDHKTGLWILGFGKCWYSEAKLQRDGGHVEHYRPKGKVAKHAHPGYWWGRFDWENFRFAHPTCNLRIKDYLDGVLAGKGTYFPLRDEAKRALCRADQKLEEPVLLDPTVAADVLLLAFDDSSGAVIPRMTKESDEWRNRRAAESIEFYHLNEGTWVAERFEKFKVVNFLCDDLEKAKMAGDEEGYEKHLTAVCSEIHPFAVFSAVGIQVLKTRGLLEAVTPG